MNPGLRWMLILGCLMLVALEVPRSSALVAEDLGGPYRPSGVESAALDARVPASAGEAARAPAESMPVPSAALHQR